ncbi:hypothetical protein LCGC14_2694010, partial [marine sediment metagenome]
MGIVSYYKDHPWVRVITIMSIIIVVIIAAMVFLSIRKHTVMMDDMMHHQGKIVTEVIVGSMKKALSIGDNMVVQEQFEQLGRNISNLDIYVFDFNRRIVFSSDTELLGQQLDDVVPDKTFINAVSEMIRTGETPSESFKTIIDGVPYMGLIRPILNEPGCTQCHSKTNKIIGGAMVQANTMKAHSDSTNSRNTSIIIG